MRSRRVGGVEPEGLPRAVQVLWMPPVRAATVEARLSGSERDRLARMRSCGTPPADQDRFATSRALLRAGVGTWMGVSPGEVTVRTVCGVCGGSDHGRPVVPLTGGAARPPQLSVTHAAEVVAVALSEAGPVGIDVEPCREPFAGFDDVALGPAEVAAMRVLSPAAATAARLRAWVRKEAVLKATGAGLTADPREVVVRGRRGRPQLISLPGGDDTTSWRLWDLDVGGSYVGALAVRHAPATLPELQVRRVRDGSLTWPGDADDVAPDVPGRRVVAPSGPQPPSHTAK